jgi:glutamyl-tRNA synthetase
MDDIKLANYIAPLCADKGYTTDPDFLTQVCRIMKSRVNLLPEFVTSGYILFTDNLEYDHESIHKKWKPELEQSWMNLIEFIKTTNTANASELELNVKSWMQENQLKPGEIMPLMRLALAGTMHGPGIFDMIELLGKERSILRMELALTVFNNI